MERDETCTQLEADVDDLVGTADAYVGAVAPVVPSSAPVSCYSQHASHSVPVQSPSATKSEHREVTAMEAEVICRQSSDSKSQPCSTRVYNSSSLPPRLGTSPGAQRAGNTHSQDHQTLSTLEVDVGPSFIADIDTACAAAQAGSAPDVERPPAPPATSLNVPQEELMGVSSEGIPKTRGARKDIDAVEDAPPGVEDAAAREVPGTAAQEAATDPESPGPDAAAAPASGVAGAGGAAPAVGVDDPTAAPAEAQQRDASLLAAPEAAGSQAAAPDTAATGAGQASSPTALDEVVRPRAAAAAAAAEAEAREELAACKAEVRTLREDLGAERRGHQETLARLAVLQARGAGPGEVAELKRRVVQLERDVDVERQHSASQSQAIRMMDENLQKAQDDAANGIKKLKLEHGEEIKEIENEHNQKLEDLQTKSFDEMEQLRAQLAAALDGARENAEFLNDQLDTANGVVDDTVASLEAAKQQHAASLDEARQEAGTVARAQMEELRAELATQATQMEGLRADLASAQRASSEELETARLKGAAAERESLRAALESAQSDARDAVASLEAAKQQHAAAFSRELNEKVWLLEEEQSRATASMKVGSPHWALRCSLFCDWLRPLLICPPALE